MHHAILVFFMGSYFAIFGLIYSFVSRRLGAAPALFAAPFFWVFLEYVKSNLSFMSFPWGLLAHSQYQYPVVILGASLTGAYGISFLIAMVNSAVSAVVLLFLQKLRQAQSFFYRRLTRGEALSIAVTAALLFILNLTYGHMNLAKKITKKGIKISVVQGDVEQSKKWERKYANFIMETYAELTQKASEDHPALIVWPETATPWSISRDAWLYGQVRRIAKTAGTYLLLGSAQHRKFKRGDTQDIKFFNSAFLFGPDRRAKNQRYDKIRLLPFGEYLPKKETIPWAYLHIPEPPGYIPGKEFTVFKGPGFQFGVTICWENIFPDQVRQLVKRGAEFIVNITNEAWFGRTAAPYQFLSMSVFRAVENRVFVVRCANTGISCFIDPYGRVIDRVKDEQSRDIFVRGILTGSVSPMESKTLYTRYGDLLVWLSLVCSLVFLGLAFAKKRLDSSLDVI
jgi:apolipoprotein N-acyltransferase